MTTKNSSPIDKLSNFNNALDFYARTFLSVDMPELRTESTENGVTQTAVK